MQYVVVDDNIRYLTVAETARRLGRSIEQIRRYLREGKLAGRRIGGQWFVEEAGLSADKPQRNQMREVATMEYTPGSTRVNDVKIEALIASIDERREAIKRRLGGNIAVDIVELLRADREEH
jgi:hypothetical protein